LSGSTPPVGPTVRRHAVDEPEAQKVFSFTVEPSLLKKASPAVSPCTSTLGAEIAVRHDGLAAVARDDVLPARDDLGDRLVPGDACELAGGVSADAAGGVEARVGV